MVAVYGGLSPKLGYREVTLKEKKVRTHLGVTFLTHKPVAPLLLAYQVETDVWPLGAFIFDSVLFRTT